MPKYRIEWNVRGRTMSLGTHVFNDDEHAVSEVAAICRKEKIGATLVRPDRKLTLATILAPEDGGPEAV